MYGTSLFCAHQVFDVIHAKHISMAVKLRQQHSTVTLDNTRQLLWQMSIYVSVCDTARQQAHQIFHEIPP